MMQCPPLRWVSSDATLAFFFFLQLNVSSPVSLNLLHWSDVFDVTANSVCDTAGQASRTDRGGRPASAHALHETWKGESTRDGGRREGQRRRRMRRRRSRRRWGRRGRKGRQRGRRREKRRARLKSRGGGEEGDERGGRVGMEAEVERRWKRWRRRKEMKYL